tara:strand:- start:215 stop:502 length:288 start_codon:yes stop_codon:yes gene_type:complete
MFSQKNKVKIEIQLGDNGLYIKDKLTANLIHSNEGLLNILINEEFGKHFSKMIDYNITNGNGEYPFQLELTSNIINRDSLKYKTKKVVKKYNKSR